MESAIRSAADERPQPISKDETDRGRLILKAALELLEEEGLDGLTIRSMLKRTGLARRAFYDRFAGKDDLVLAVFEITLREGASFFEERVAPLSDPFEKMEFVVRSLVLGHPTPPDRDIAMNDKRSAALSREHLRLAEARPAELQAALAPLLGFIAGMISEGIEQGKFRPCDPELLAGLIFNLVATTLHTELLLHEGGKPDLDRRSRIADEIWEFCRRAIKA